MIFLCRHRQTLRAASALLVAVFLCLRGGTVPLCAETQTGDALVPSQLYSRSCALMDGYSGRLLFGKEEGAARANASTTKILTCILVLELSDVEAEATVSKRAAGQPKVRLGMKEGESYRVLDLLYCLMLESYNDCAVVLAEHVSGSVEAFAQLMNEKAAQLGCTDTFFLTPNGLDAENENGFHHTTAQDLCRIMRYCVWGSESSAAFLEITGTSTYQFQDPRGTWHTAANHNQLLGTMEGAVSGKTGFTADAGYCYVMAYELAGKRFTAAFLGCGWPNNRTYKWKDARRLMEYAQTKYSLYEYRPSPALPGLRLSGCYTGEADLAAWGSDAVLSTKIDEPLPVFYFMLSPGDRMSDALAMQETATVPLHAGAPVGTYRVLLNDEVIAEWTVCARENADTWSLSVFRRLVLREFVHFPVI